jgi:SPX domain protein involved in polyphosphate accumulation
VRGLRLESWKSRTGLWWAVSKDGSRFVSWTDAQVDKVWTFVYKSRSALIPRAQRRDCVRAPIGAYGWWMAVPP